jgi:hypothetical protein
LTLRAKLTLLAAALLAAFAAGCGPSPDQSFTASDHPLSFDFPGDWTLTRSGSGGGAISTLTVALNQPHDQVTISQYKLKKALPSGKNGYRSEVDRIVNRLTRAAKGQSSAAKVVKYGGMPGYQYVLKYDAGGVKLQNRVTFLFSGGDEFQLSCQSAAENREQLDEGCQQILDSLKRV